MVPKVAGEGNFWDARGRGGKGRLLIVGCRSNVLDVLGTSFPIFSWLVGWLAVIVIVKWGKEENLLLRLESAAWMMNMKWLWFVLKR